MPDHPTNKVRKLSPRRRTFLRRHAEALLSEGKTVSDTINAMMADRLCSRALAIAIMRYVKAYRNYTWSDKTPPQPGGKGESTELESPPATL